MLVEHHYIEPEELIIWIILHIIAGITPTTAAHAIVLFDMTALGNTKCPIRAGVPNHAQVDAWSGRWRGW